MAKKSDFSGQPHHPQSSLFASHNQQSPRSLRPYTSIILNTKPLKEFLRSRLSFHIKGLTHYVAVPFLKHTCRSVIIVSGTSFELGLGTKRNDCSKHETAHTTKFGLLFPIIVKLIKSSCGNERAWTHSLNLHARTKFKRVYYTKHGRNRKELSRIWKDIRSTTLCICSI